LAVSESLFGDGAHLPKKLAQDFPVPMMSYFQTPEEPCVGQIISQSGMLASKPLNLNRLFITADIQILIYFCAVAS
jgi:hypothetical protein